MCSSAGVRPLRDGGPAAPVSVQALDDEQIPSERARRGVGTVVSMTEGLLQTVGVSWPRPNHLTPSSAHLKAFAASSIFLFKATLSSGCNDSNLERRTGFLLNCSKRSSNRW